MSSSPPKGDVETLAPSVPLVGKTAPHPRAFRLQLGVASSLPPTFHWEQLSHLVPPPPPNAKEAAKQGEDGQPCAAGPQSHRHDGWRTDLSCRPTIYSCVRLNLPRDLTGQSAPGAKNLISSLCPHTWHSTGPSHCLRFNC